MINFPSYQLALETEYERVYETEISYFILLTTTGYHQHSANGAGRVFSLNSTQPIFSGRKSREHTGN